MGLGKDILSKYAKSINEIDPFDKNTLKYVGVAFQFDTITNFDDLQADFYTAVKQILPYKTSHSASEGSLMLTLSPEQNQFGFNQQCDNYIEYTYQDSKENPSIRVITNKKKIDFQCIEPSKNYKIFQKFLHDIMDIFTCFTNVYMPNSNLNLMELVLRKINKIQVNDDIQYLNQDFLYENKLFGYKNIISSNSYKEFSTIEDSGETIEFKSGIIQEDQDSDSGIIIYDFMVRQDNPNVLKLDKDVLMEILENFSLKIYNLYCYCVGEDYIDKVLKK